MTSEERELMTATIRAAVADAIAPLSNRLTVLETQHVGERRWVDKLLGPLVAAVIAAIVAAVVGRAPSQ